MDVEQSNSNIGGNGPVDTNTQRSIEASEVPESAVSVTGSDEYTTILTPSKVFSRIKISNPVTSNPAVVSIDNGVTATFPRIEAGAIEFYAGVALTTANIKAKNYTAGSNYTNLCITVW